MKINITNILLGILVVLLLVNSFKPVQETKAPDVIINIPEQSGSTGKVIVKDSIVYKKIYLKGKEIIVDSKYKELYEIAISENDQLAQRNLFLESIKINEKDITLVDNDTIKATLWAKNRGELLEYKFDWKLKESNYSYSPETVSRRPKLSLVLGTGAGIPYRPGAEFSLKGDVGFQTRNGDIFTTGPDTEGKWWVNYKKTFTILK